MRFADPGWLLLLVVPLGLGGIMLRNRAAPPRLRIGFPALGFLDDTPPSRWGRWRRLADALRLVAVVLLIGALARPQVPHEVRQGRSKGPDNMLPPRNSRRMKATDVK